MRLEPVVRKDYLVKPDNDRKIKLSNDAKLKKL